MASADRRPDERGGAGRASPEAERIRAFHAKSLKQSREKLFLFLSGWAGGPQLYLERFGHPRLRMRHLPFLIGSAERDQWLWCMNRALDESGLDPQLVEFLKTRFAEVADFMRNKPEDLINLQDVSSPPGG